MRAWGKAASSSTATRWPSTVGRSRVRAPTSRCAPCATCASRAGGSTGADRRQTARPAAARPDGYAGIMRVLLAGGAGYIGAHTAVSLLDAGHEVVVLDDLSGTSPVAADRVARITGKPVPLVVGDAADREVVEGVFAAHGPIDAIIHLAAFKAVGESTQIPLEYYRNNLDTTFALVEVGVRHGIRSFVFSSTGTVYSEPADLPFTEESTTSVDPSNAYSKSKRMNEVVLADVARVNPELNVTVLRYFNPVGAHPSALIGEDPAGLPNHLHP